MSLIRNVHASMLRFCADFAEANQLTVVNFDAHADESTIPASNIVGMSGLSLDVDDHILSVNIMFGISTKDDTNMFELIRLLDPLFELLLPTKKIRAYNADTGEQTGWFVVQNGTRVLPVGGSVARPLQHIMVGLLSTVTFNLAELAEQ
jgi:hypothetical protein